MTSCPCCGSQVDRPVIVSLDMNVVSTAMGSVRVPPRQAEVLFVLAKKFPQTVRRDTLGIEVFGERWWDVCRNSLDMQVSMSRKAMKPLGFDINVIYGVGYRLSPSKSEGA